MQTYKLRRQQQKGATLIITLVVLTAMTILGISSIRNTSIHQLIVKNTQMLFSARKTAFTEINGQLDIINTNHKSENDQIITDLLNDADGKLPIADTSGESNNTPEKLAVNHAAMGQTVSVTLVCKACTVPVGGFSIGTGLSAVIGVINSQATIENNATQSTQEQIFWYLIPTG
jgi:Tfp pilus assembly protein PilX